MLGCYELRGKMSRKVRQGHRRWRNWKHMKWNTVTKLQKNSTKQKLHLKVFMKRPVWSISSALEQPVQTEQSLAHVITASFDPCGPLGYMISTPSHLPLWGIAKGVTIWKNSHSQMGIWASWECDQNVVLHPRAETKLFPELLETQKYLALREIQWQFILSPHLSL